MHYTQHAVIRNAGRFGNLNMSTINKNSNGLKGNLSETRTAHTAERCAQCPKRNCKQKSFEKN